MREQSPRVLISVEDRVTVVELTDKKILDEVSISQIGDQLFALVTRSEYPLMVIDFSTVSHMSSSALGMLITLHKRIREKDGKLCLCCIQPQIYEIFVITRLNEIFDIAANRDQALDKLK